MEGPDGQIIPFLIATDPISPDQPTDSESLYTLVLELRKTALYEEQSGCFGEAEVLWKKATGLAERYLPNTQLFARVAIDTGKFIFRFLPRSQIPLKYLRAGLSLSHLLDPDEVMTATFTIVKCLIGWNDFNQAENVLGKFDRSSPEIDTHVQCCFGMIEHAKQDILKAESILREAAEKAQFIQPELHAECIVHVSEVLLEKEQYFECQCLLSQAVQFLVSSRSSLLSHALRVLMNAYIDTNQFKLMDSTLESVIEKLKAANASPYYIAGILTDWGDCYSKISPTNAALRYIQSLRLYRSVRPSSWYIVRVLHKLLENQGISRFPVWLPDGPLFLGHPRNRAIFKASGRAFSRSPIKPPRLGPPRRRLSSFMIPRFGLPARPLAEPSSFEPPSLRTQITDLVSTTSLASLEAMMSVLPVAATALCISISVMGCHLDFEYPKITWLRQKLELLFSSSDDIESGEALLCLANINQDSKLVTSYVDIHSDSLLSARLLAIIYYNTTKPIEMLRRLGGYEHEIYNYFMISQGDIPKSVQDLPALSISFQTVDDIVYRFWNTSEIRQHALHLAETINPYSSRYFEVLWRLNQARNFEDTVTQVLQANSHSPISSNIIKGVCPYLYMTETITDSDQIRRCLNIIDTMACNIPIHFASLDLAMEYEYFSVVLVSFLKHVLLFCVDNVKSIVAHYQLLKTELNWFYEKELDLVLSCWPPQLEIVSILLKSEKFSQRHDYMESLVIRGRAAIGSMKYEDSTYLNSHFTFLRELYGRFDNKEERLPSAPRRNAK